MSFRSLHTRCKECNEVMTVRTDNPDVVYCGCEGFTAPKAERCGVKCAHKDDVHDCEWCVKWMAFGCEALCVKCPKEGYDLCQCSNRDHNLNTCECADCVADRKVGFDLMNAAFPEVEQ